ncbi:nickel pincer cofactor biosynthesis protein LarB [Heliorestis convoluta]|uniref:1-(5-phosphoribosyl)-5-amino-4-imidazole-carboxylate (AIR) c n=1 Tax=Heliorestis convoluta TaxID=356322 RepID=A0A5Q2N136_9FIRM|nr:nickel pincer cofactor biosynthesis protein LarB [Heliorestis convoluta]QGG47002.1 1-(5-phosphoribosyl)-5-amino-4-imidazole-carboxylate (AIR) c [Heliorestis convoluta]
MDPVELKRLLLSLKDDSISLEEAMDRLKGWPYEDLGYAKVDHCRSANQGFPEVIFGLGKTPEQVGAVFQRLAEKGNPVLATRCDEKAFEAVQAFVPEATFHSLAKVISYRIPECTDEQSYGRVAILSAGTADLPVAEEAVITARAMGCYVEPIFDVGVAGLHRLLDHRNKLATMDALVVVAGMEGALASVVAGMSDRPVIAVPTSVGYGANFGGLSALLTMLNSCAVGVGVVNIDNGFGGAALAATIVRSSYWRKAQLAQGDGKGGFL